MKRRFGSPVLAVLFSVLLFLTSAALVYGALFEKDFVLPCAALIVLEIVLFLIFTFAAYARAKKRRVSEDWTQSVSMEFLSGVSLPVLFLSEHGEILWTNDAFGDLVGKNASELSDEELDAFLDEPLGYERLKEQAPIELRIADCDYKLLPYCVSGEREGSYVCVLIDLSEEKKLRQELKMRNPLIVFFAVDNVSDDPAMSDAAYRGVLARIAPLLEEWAQGLDGVLREVGRDRYLCVIEEARLEEVCAARFDILDQVRALSAGVVEIPVTISAGVAVSAGTLHEKELASYQALDTALQRGGDQAVVRRPGGTVEYFGGRTKTVQRRNRIRSRVVANELSNLVRKSERVLIMGHAMGDHDSFGASVGVARFCMELGAKVNIVLRRQDPNLSPLMETLSGIPEYAGVFLDPASAQDLVGPDTLLIVVDTNNPRTFESPELYENSPTVVIIDHHRKTDEFIVAPKITYIDPVSSSACEMVSEILEQGLERGKLHREEAELLFAGIMLDTKQFTRNTGTRTFAAALYLREMEANPAQTMRLFKTDLDTMLSELEFEQNVVLYRDVIAIAASDKKGTARDKIAASRAADRLLNLKHVQASFALCMIDDCIHISARSAGKVNVQLILERLHGGGYFDAAGAQLRGFDFTGALELLKQSIDAYLDDQL